VDTTERNGDAMTEAEKRERQFARFAEKEFNAMRAKVEKWFADRGSGPARLLSWDCVLNAVTFWAIEHAQTRASEESDGWISVNDELPPIGQDVMVVIDGIVQKCPAARCEDGWEWFIEDADMAPLNIVTHWRPLPSPPSAAQETGK